MNDTIVLFSSSRKNGNTAKLLSSVASRVDVDILDLSEYNIGEYDYEHKNSDDDFLPLMHKVLDYEKIIFASPVYWYSVTPTMKKFLDRISDLLDVPELLPAGRRLRGKTAFVLCSSISTEVSSSFIGMFEETFNYLGMSYGGCLHADCADEYRAEVYDDDALRFVASLA